MKLILAAIVASFLIVACSSAMATKGNLDIPIKQIACEAKGRGHLVYCIKQRCMQENPDRFSPALFSPEAQYCLYKRTRG